jgi:hypothetical protein
VMQGLPERRKSKRDRKTGYAQRASEDLRQAITVLDDSYIQVGLNEQATPHYD